MTTDAVGPNPSSALTWGPDLSVPADDAAQPPAAFAEVLQRQLGQHRDELARVRAEVQAIRDGGAIWDAGGVGAAASRGPALRAYGDTVALGAAAAGAFVLPEATGPVSDPYGWRAMARTTAERIIGDGYGPLFERQIQQESGFEPDVVLGHRVSSAGAEGIAQLMPQYYAHVDRTDPQAALIAGAQTMRHYLQAWDGDVRKALASYNAGLGRVRQLVDAHGALWERGLPEETRRYLAEILGPQQATFLPDPEAEAAVFGGRGPGGVLSSPLGGVLDRQSMAGLLELTALAGNPVSAPADGVVASITDLDGLTTLLLDHGNGWQTTLAGLDALTVATGDSVRRGEDLGTLAGLAGEAGLLRLRVLLDGRPVEASRYILG